MIKNNENNEGVSIFYNTYLHAAYADYSTFFLKNLNSARKLLNTIEIFSSFTGLKPNLSKCEISLIGTLKEIIVAVCGIKCIVLTKECLKIPVFIIHIIRKILKNKKKKEGIQDVEIEKFNT